MPTPYYPVGKTVLEPGIGYLVVVPAELQRRNSDVEYVDCLVVVGVDSTLPTRGGG